MKSSEIRKNVRYSKLCCGLFARFFFTFRQNIVELVLWSGYSFIIIGKAGTGANYTARSIKFYAFGWNVPHMAFGE